MAQSLAKFTVTKTTDENFLLHIEDDSGETLELEASYDQLELLVESIDEQLEADADDHDEIDDDDVDVDAEDKAEV